MECLVLLLKATAFTAGARGRTELGEMNPEFCFGCYCSCDVILSLVLLVEIMLLGKINVSNNS